MKRLALALAVTGCLTAAAAAQECGGVETPCEIESGRYFIRLPDPGVAAQGTVLWLHGYGGSGRSDIASAGLVEPMLARGYAVIAADGLDWPEKGVRTDWGVVDGFDWRRDDILFLEAVIADAAARFDIRTDRLVASGFSRGGSMVWDLVCARPEAFIGAAPISGGFWEPMTRSCAGPVHLFHTHGFTDRTVPLEGRKAVFNGFPFHQGNILEGLDVWRETDGCMGAADVDLAADGDWEKHWTSCESGSIVLWLHPGGHMIPPGWVDRMLDWADALAADAPQ
ncbi:MAG: polyhydroxybutyrate depolymerase [Rhodobacteraceae bacterium]|nr:polyhydroxybutyrate depolymerase [Paracoccaceae bacterium]